jgi:hypothetical protein
VGLFDLALVGGNPRFDLQAVDFGRAQCAVCDVHSRNTTI